MNSNFEYFAKYKLTNEIEWSKKISHRRLRFVGHIARSLEAAPAKVSLYESTRVIKKPKRRHPNYSAKGFEKSAKRNRISKF